MANILTSKRIQLDKATRTMVIAVAIASFVVLFCIFSAHSLSTVLSYQNRVIAAQSHALNTLKTDVTAKNQLESAYTKFNNTSGNNLLGASSTGNGPNQGDNAKLVLDALPSVDDYPATVVSIENLLNNQPVSISGINVSNTAGGTGVAAASSSVATASPIPISFSVTGSISSIESYITHLSQSILPIQFLSVSLAAEQSNITMSVTAQTYYQAPIAFNVTTETVK